MDLGESLSPTTAASPSNTLVLWPIYEYLATRRLFGDSKVFVDMPTNGDPVDILNRFRKLQQSSALEDDRALLAFLEKWFLPPGSDLISYAGRVDDTGVDDTGVDDTGKHSTRKGSTFDRNNLVRLVLSLAKRSHSSLDGGSYSTLIPTPHPFVIPGERFRESYYWDSYWILKGLLAHGDHINLCLGIVRNFALMVESIGYVPNGFRRYYLNRSQPPMLTCMVFELSQVQPGIVAEFLPVLKKELLFWRNSDRTFKEESSGLTVSRYFSTSTMPRAESLWEDLETLERRVRNTEQVIDTEQQQQQQQFFRNICAAAESGWDFSSRWLDQSDDLVSIRTTRVLPVDLNAILAKSERLVSEMAGTVGDEETQNMFCRMYKEREQSLRTLFWDDHKGKWRDVLLQDSESYRATGFAREEDYASDWVPLWCLEGDITARRRAIKSLENSHINQRGGIAASSVSTGQQWDWPNVWPPSQYFLAEGCWMLGVEGRRLGDSIRDRYIESSRLAWQAHAALPEKFDCMTVGSSGSGGEYAVQMGFGWSLGLCLCPGWLS
jgi:alpha,alpha-trehalase